jgi:hypothetical protein
LFRSFVPVPSGERQLAGLGCWSGIAFGGEEPLHECLVRRELMVTTANKVAIINPLVFSPYGFSLLFYVLSFTAASLVFVEWSLNSAVVF